MSADEKAAKADPMSENTKLGPTSFASVQAGEAEAEAAPKPDMQPAEMVLSDKSFLRDEDAPLEQANANQSGNISTEANFNQELKPADEVAPEKEVAEGESSSVSAGAEIGQTVDNLTPDLESAEGKAAAGRESAAAPLAGNGGEPPEEPPFSPTAEDKKDPEDDKGGEGMGLLDHLAELRRCLLRACVWAIIGFVVCWIFVDDIFDLLINPLLAILPEGTHAQYTTLPEAFFTRVYVAFVAGLFLASPAIFYQIWAFVAPGLYDEEKRWIIPIALLSAIFFIAGAVFCYFIVFPFAFAFFISYSTPDIVITPKVSDYLNFVIKLLLAFGLIFEMPIFTFFLARLGIVTAAMMRKARRYAIVAIFILAAILTPPDVVSQLFMAVPMLLLYEASIVVALVFGKRKKADKPEGKEEANA